MAVMKPKRYFVERWMRLRVPSTPGNHERYDTLFFFSGVALFDTPTVGGECEDCAHQITAEECETSDECFAHDWNPLDLVCPIVVSAPHDQDNCDIADAMGYQIMDMEHHELLEIQWH